MNRTSISCTKYFKLIICCIYSLLLATHPGFSQDTTMDGAKGFSNPKTTAGKKAVKGNTYAIILGVSTYSKIKSLDYADKDAELFRDFLMSPAGGNLKLGEHIYFSENEDVKWADFLGKLVRWVDKKSLKPNDRLIIYFSGHGDSYLNNYFLLTYDCDPQNDPSNYAMTALNMHYLKTWFIMPQIEKGAEVMLIVDACRTNELPGGVKGRENFSNGFDANANVPGELLMLSTGAGKESYEHKDIGKGHGLFTYYLIDGLYGAADTEGDDANHNGQVDFEELGKFVQSKVKKDALRLFGKEQRPIFKPDEKYSEVMSVINTDSYAAWTKGKEKKTIVPGEGAMFADARIKGKGKGIGLKTETDSVLLGIYSKFTKALKAETLMGDGSAEDYYDQLQKRWPDNSITEDARYDLAGELLDFAQQKINLYLSGKGVTQLRFMEERLQKVNTKAGEESKTVLPDGAEQIDKMKKVVNTSFGTAAKMIEKATTLLKSEPALLEAIYPKLYFLKAASLNNSSNKAKLLEGISYCRKAIAIDKNAAYNYLLMGQLMYDMNDDSCEYYYKKAAQLAPKWAYPLNGLGNYYSDNHKNDLAISYYKKAIALDTLNSFVIQNLGSIYHNLNQADSAKYYYYKALAINACDANSNGNLGSLFTDSVDFSKPDGKYYFRLAKTYLKKSIQCDKYYTWSYKKLSALFIKANEVDSSNYYLQLAVEANPENAEGYRNMADMLLAQKDIAGAEKWYLRGIEADKADVNGYLELGYFYAKTGNTKKAAEIYQAAAAKYPNKPEVYNYMGIMYEKSDTEKALEYYKKALDINPTLTYVLSNIGSVYSRQKKLDEAVKYYTKAIQIDSLYLTAYQGLGTLYLNNYQYDKATAYYLKAYRIEPDNLTTNFNLGYIYRKQELYDKAIPYYLEVMQLDPKDPDPYHSLGMIYHNKNDLDKAEKYFSAAVLLDSTDADLQWHLGSIKTDRGDVALEKGDKPTAAANYDDAIKAFTLGSKHTSKPSEYFAKVGFLYYKKDGLAKAVSYYQGILKRYPKDASMYYNIGKLYLEENNAAEALKYYERSLVIDSTQTEVLQDVGNIYLSEYKIKEKAYAYFDKAIKLHKVKFEASPEDDKIASDIAFLYFRKQEYAGAISYFKQAIVLNPSTTYYHYLGHSYEYSGNTEAALDNFLLYIKSKPDNAEIYSHIGDMYSKLKNYTQAISYYNQGLTHESTEKLYTGLGYAYLYSNQVEPAIEAFSKAIAAAPEKANTYYNLACAYSIQKNAAKAIENLKSAFTKGYNDYEHVLEDSDLVFARQQPAFKQLVMTYFPEK